MSTGPMGRRNWGSPPASGGQSPARPVRVEPPSDPFGELPPEPAAEAPPEDLLAGLTDPQRKAVLCTEGPLLVLAAAGSGKTRVITRRIAHLVGMGVPPWSILALTFTNKAAGEMRERVLHLLGGDADSRRVRGLTVTTFHSLCARLLRKYADRAGLKPEFTIYDSGDQTALCKKTIEALGMSTSNWPARSVLSTISAAKNELLDAAAYSARAMDFYAKSIAKIYAAYEKALHASGAVDFDDLLVLTAKLLKEDKDVRAECNQRWQYLLIDEYQDTNHAQFVIASLLAGDGPKEGPRAGAGPNICVVGDPDQAIYGWRGADITNILEFEENYPRCSVITLGENFRSTAPILAVADTLIRNNQKRKHKDLFTSRQGGDRIDVTLCLNEQHESNLIVDWFKRLHEASGQGDSTRAGIPWREMAVFYRTNSLSRVVEEAFRTAGVPYSIARGTSFYEREEIKNALSYLRVVANTSDDVSLERIVNTPARGIGDASLGKIAQWGAAQGLSLFESLRRTSEGSADAMGITSRAQNAVSKFVALVQEWTGGGTFMGAQVPTSLAVLVERVVKESGLEAMYTAQAKTSGNESDAERLDNLSELVSSARQFELEFDPDSDPAEFPGEAAIRAGKSSTPPLLSMLRAYLESVALVADADAVDPAQGAVTLMTLHAAKGLEFTAAAIIGLEEGLLPHSRAQESNDQLEEERRLCFVGITRAMRHLHVTSAKYRTIRGIPERTIPSRFLDEFPREHIRMSDQAETINQAEDADWTDGSNFSDFDDEARQAKRRAAAAAAAAPGNALAAKFPVGCRVRHPQFGLGKIKSVSGGPQARATVEFAGVGTKTLVLEYARLQRVD